MITEEKLSPIFDSIDPNNKTVSILLVTIIKRDGVEISRENHRKAFCPGEIEQVKEYCGVDDSPEIQYLSAIWTPEVIENYQLLQQGV